LQENSKPIQPPTDLNTSENELSFSSYSPIRRKKEAIVIQSSIKMVEKVEEELSALRPKNPYAYPEPDPNELYSNRTKEQLRQLRSQYHPFVAKHSIWQLLH